MTKILVVDDDQALLRALAINLRARHFEVETASDGASALRHASTFLPDAVVLDLGLPDLDGVEVVHHLVAVISLRQEDPLAERVNRDGVGTVARAALRAGVL